MGRRMCMLFCGSGGFSQFNFLGVRCTRWIVDWFGTRGEHLFDHYVEDGFRGVERIAATCMISQNFFKSKEGITKVVSPA